MTKESLIAGISRLIEKRKQTTDTAEIDRLNNKLTKLYNLKYTMLQQEQN